MKVDFAKIGNTPLETLTINCKLRKPIKLNGTETLSLYYSDSKKPYILERIMLVNSDNLILLYQFITHFEFEVVSRTRSFYTEPINPVTMGVIIHPPVLFKDFDYDQITQDIWELCMYHIYCDPKRYGYGLRR